MMGHQDNRNPGSRVPFFPAVNLLSAATGSIYYHAASGKRKRMIRELGSTLGVDKDESTRIVKKFFRHYMNDKLEVFLYPRLNEENIDRITETSGLEHLDQALSEGRGAVLVHAHLGNPQMLMPALGHRGYAVRQVGLSPEDVYHGVRKITGGRLNVGAFLWLRIKERFEKSLPVKFVHLGRVSLKNVYESLDRNALVAMTVDGVHGDKLVWEFLGRKTTHFMDGAARIAVKSGAPLLPLFMVRLEDGRHRLVIKPPISVDRAAGRSRAAVSATEAFLRILEGYIRERPWLYARFFGFHDKPFFLPAGESGM